MTPTPRPTPDAPRTDDPQVHAARPTASDDARKPFAAPRLDRHAALPAVTAGSVMI